MYQNAIAAQKSLFAIAVAIGLVMTAGTALAANTADGCVSAIIKEAQGFAQKKANALRKCEDGILNGKVTGPCPDAKNADKISGAMTKALAGIAKKCDGLETAGVENGDCIGAGDPDPCCTAANAGSCFPSNLGYGDNCPRAACAGAIDTVSDLADCVICNTMEITDALAEQAYGPLNAPSADKAVLGCQRTIGKEVVGAFRKISKAKQKCEAGVIQGKITSCPDAKTTDQVNKALTKLSEKIAGKCPDQPTIDAAANGAGLFGAFGGLSNADATTESVAEAQVQVSLNAPVCGNATIEAGEDCDDGNNQNDDGKGPADVCPSDCTIGPCTVGGDQQVTVNFATASLVGDMTILLAYDDTAVRIPGSGNDSAVNAALSSTSFSFTPNDTDTALRIVLLDGTFSGVPAGEAFVVQLDTCTGAPAPTAADFQCFVVSAADENFAPVTDATCSVTIP